jgi:hypothetical protein
MRTSRALACTALLSILASPAWSYCSAPRPPSTMMKPDKPRKPTVPYCVNEFTSKHTCETYQIDAYNSEVEAYNGRLRTYRSEIESYVQELQNFVKEAERFAICEIESLQD